MGVIDMIQGNLADSDLPKYKNQNYDKIKRKVLKDKSGSGYWTDPTFGPNDTTLWEGKPKLEIEWKRAKEIHADARLFVGGHSEDDVKQGSIGNCWFVASVACFALHDKLVKKVIPDYEKQDMGSEDYCGVLLFRFYRFGEWLEVVIDDFLPTKGGKLAFMHSTDPSELWCAYLEKAYAKLAGSYEALDAGSSADALSDLTGGISQHIEFQKDGYNDDEMKREKLFRDLEKAMSRDSLINISMIVRDGESSESKRDSGLIVGHAYTVMESYELALGFLGLSDKHKLIKVRNPWGGTEWTGKWGDNDPQWADISSSKRKELGFTNEDDGEFWMEYEDLLSNFDNITICRVMNTDISLTRKRWYMSEVKGRWEAGLNAGGCANFPDTYFTNPQIQFEIKEVEDETVQIVLEQKDRRIDDEENLIIGYRTFKLNNIQPNEDSNDPSNTQRLHSKKGAATVGKTKFTNSRQVYSRLELEIGVYIVIPSTFEQNLEGEFILKVFTEDKAFVTELQE